MNRSTPTGGTHLDEGDLMRFVDGEMSVDERRRAAEHLLACRRCAEAADALRAERRQFAELLGGFSVEPVETGRRAQALAAIERAADRRQGRNRRGNRTALLRAAAVAGLLVASALATSPVRAFVSDLWNSITDRVERLAESRVEVVEPAPISLNNSAIGFVPNDDVFVIEIRSPQPGGSLVLGIGSGQSVMARAIDGTEPVSIVVLPSGMRIENHPEATADYGVSLPPTLREVRVRVADAEEIVYPIDTLTDSWVSVVDLGR